MVSEEQKLIIRQVLTPFEPSYVGMFGSFARGEAKQGSDPDLLVSFKKRVHLLDQIGAEQELTERLGLSVDLVTEQALSYLIRPYVEEDLVEIT